MYDNIEYLDVLGKLGLRCRLHFPPPRKEKTSSPFGERQQQQQLIDVCFSTTSNYKEKTTGVVKKNFDRFMVWSE